MIAAIYARKSTDDSDRNEEARSTTRQIEGATKYAEAKGWTVDPRYIFVDENTSGAEWKNRPGFNALLAALEPRPPFDVLVVSELTRIGRASARTLYAITQIEEAGVAIHGYLKGRLITLEDEAGEVETMVDSLVSSLERRRASQRTYDALRRRAEAGAVTGGKLFGYRNERNGDGFVIRVIDEGEAIVIRRIWTLFSDGSGLTRISKALNREGVPSPRGNGWTGSCVRVILRQRLYCGVLVWNRSQKVTRKGRTKAQRRRPTTEWFEKSMPELRIIPPELEARVATRLQAVGAAFTRRAGGRFFVRAGRLDGESPYLLTGHLTCARCRGPLGGRTQLHGSGPAARRTRVTHYHCTTFARRGPTICDNTHVLRTEIIDTALLTALRTAIAPDMVEEAIRRALAVLTESHAALDGQRADLERQVAGVEARISRIVSAITAGGALETLVSQLKTEEQQQKLLRARLAQIEAARGLGSLDIARVTSEVRGLAADVVALLSQERTPQTRAMLRKLLPYPIDGEPIVVNGRRGYRFKGRVSFASFLGGDVLEALKIDVARKQPDGAVLSQPDGGGPNGIRHTDVFPAVRWLTRLPFDGLALAG
jgi:DNA invertase Pin-like site-specific DNA recombinase